MVDGPIDGQQKRSQISSTRYAFPHFRQRRADHSQNIVWTLALFWYQIYNNFDVTYLFDYTHVLLFNVAFTSLPVIIMGVLDQDVSDKVSLAVPQLYRRGIERKEWTQLKFW